MGETKNKSNWPLKPVTNKAMSVLKRHDVLKERSPQEYAQYMYDVACDAKATQEICEACFEKKYSDEMSLDGFAQAVQDFLSKYLAG